MAPARDHLLAAAREEFLTHGYKKTGIAAIAQRAGMAVGSVYAFYASKKELFIDVYQAENTASKTAIAAGIDWARPREALLSYVEANLAAVRANAILAEWSTDGIGSVLRDRCAAAGTSGATWDFLNQQFQRWRDEGKTAPNATPELVEELFTAANLLDASGLVGMETQRFMMEAIIDRLFIARVGVS